MTGKEARTLVNNILKVAQPKKTGRPSLDPLSKVWPQLMADTSISACNYWKVEFKNDEWAFKASATKFATAQDFADWFHQMGDAIAHQAVIPEKAEPLESTPSPLVGEGGQRPG